MKTCKLFLACLAVACCCSVMPAPANAGPLRRIVRAVVAPARFVLKRAKHDCNCGEDCSAIRCAANGCACK